MVNKKATPRKPKRSSQSSAKQDVFKVAIRKDEEQYQGTFEMDQWSRRIVIDVLTFQQDSESKNATQLGQELVRLKTLLGQSDRNLEGVQYIQKRIGNVSESVATSTSFAHELDQDVLLYKAAYSEMKDRERLRVEALNPPVKQTGA